MGQAFEYHSIYLALGEAETATFEDESRYYGADRMSAKGFFVTTPTTHCRQRS
jgi:hypothetical protein